MMTPAASRFWPSDSYAPDGPQPSFDKQFVRDYLESIRWNKQPPVPALPDDVVARTRAKYLDAYRRLTGRALDPTRAYPARTAGRRDGRKGDRFSRCPAGLRAPLHRARAAALRWQRGQ